MCGLAAAAFDQTKDTPLNPLNNPIMKNFSPLGIAYKNRNKSSSPKEDVKKDDSILQIQSVQQTGDTLQ